MVRPVWGFPHLGSLILTSRYHLSPNPNQQQKSCWHPPLFYPLNAGLEVAIMEPDSLLFPPAFDCAPGAVFGAVGAWDKSSPTYRTVACGANAVQKRCFQCRVIGQHRIPEPLANQSTGIPLRTDIAVGMVKEQAGAIGIVAAPLSDERAHLTLLCPGKTRLFTHCQTPA